MPSVRTFLRAVAAPFVRPDGYWAVHCPACSHPSEDFAGLALDSLTVSRAVAQGVADRHNKTSHNLI